jgi:hypothetical protein
MISISTKLYLQRKVNLNRFLPEAKKKRIQFPFLQQKTVRTEVTLDIQNTLLDSNGIAAFFIAQ